jgi:hypothetical protein
MFRTLFAILVALPGSLGAYELSNTLDIEQSQVPHRAQFNLMMAFRPANSNPGIGLTFNFHANYLIMKETYVMIEAPTFFTSHSTGQSYFSNVGLGVRHRFKGIPWGNTHLDLFGVFRFPNQYKVLTPGIALTIFWAGCTWKLEPWVDFIFPLTLAPSVRLAFRASIAYPVWPWFTVSLSLNRSSGFASHFFPIAVTDPTQVFTYAHYAVVGLALQLNERITGHINTALSIGLPSSNGNLKNVLVGAQYVL